MTGPRPVADVISRLPVKYRGQIERICTAAGRRYQRVRKREQLGGFFDPLRPTLAQARAYGKAAAARIPVNRWIIARAAQLQLLPQPPSGWRDMLGLIMAIEQNNITQIRAARAGRLDRFAIAYRRTVSFHERLWRVGYTAGFTGGSPCAAVL